MNLKALDVISTRVWLDQRIATKFPANVLAGFEPGVGGTYFNLTELQVQLLTRKAKPLPCPFSHAIAVNFPHAWSSSVW